MKDAITKAFDESIRVKQAFLRDNLETLISAIDAVSECFRRGNKLMIFGNGGSAADAQHIAAEFTKLIVAQRAYTANTRVVTTSDEMLQETLNMRR